ncbi:TSC22 domain family protein 1 isoform X3 [Xyrauchen texanus]|uniref:TSC22 domain family protein 1 isoform X3 n=1 Tax=Xyrauchen texanus TaxID=154827 RepID=UPI002241CDB7|nr:TSC22 domain family protein 1 isoform X3 [Xyrauchen texanus]
MRETGLLEPKGPVMMKKMTLRLLYWELQHYSSSGASVVAIDNKIEQAMDLVKSHLMYAVREEVEVLKEQIKELIERNSQLEQENTLLKNLASPEQLLSSSRRSRRTPRPLEVRPDPSHRARAPARPPNYLSMSDSLQTTRDNLTKTKRYCEETWTFRAQDV